ncbi:MAG: hypothetical protein EXR75_00460 [Myxococcales bacterium]|nr:hypothetical protein [Myxococcales bacterium]
MRLGRRFSELALLGLVSCIEPGLHARSSLTEAPLQIPYDHEDALAPALERELGKDQLRTGHASRLRSEGSASVGDVRLTRARSLLGERIELGLEQDSLTLLPGRWTVHVAVPARHHVTIGVRGPAGALRKLTIIGGPGLTRLRSGALADDGRLPAFVSFETPRRTAEVLVVIDVDHSVQVLRAVAERFPSIDGAAAEALPLVGFPSPTEGRAGYQLETPPRYSFVRADVAAALKRAFKRTKRRFRRNAITIGDASQWNGGRPATDLGHRRHISHEGGRDVDLGLPSMQGSSRIWTRCRVVRTPPDRAECAEDSVVAFDAERMAYFLATLIDGPRRAEDDASRHRPKAVSPSGHGPRPHAEIEAILLDRAYIAEVREALAKLYERGLVGAATFAQLSEGRLLRHSPWHVDHVHLRFAGASAVTPEALDFEVLPSNTGMVAADDPSDARSGPRGSTPAGSAAPD